MTRQAAAPAASLPDRALPAARRARNEWYSTRPHGASDDATQPHAPVPGRAPMLSDLPFDAPDTPAGWLAAAGTWLVVLSFPLPWLSSPFLSWFAAWGFTPAANLVPFLLALVVAFGSITPSRLPSRLRLGYGPLVVGLVGVGIAWGAIVLLSGAGIGVSVLVVGAVLAAGGGGWTLLRRDRASGLL